MLDDLRKDALEHDFEDEEEEEDGGPAILETVASGDGRFLGYHPTLFHHGNLQLVFRQVGQSPFGWTTLPNF